jgi:putative ABC transport system substrate-binding protein
MGQAGRRRFLIGSGATLVASMVSAQQAGRTYRLGVMLSGSERDMKVFLLALRDRLSNNGFIEGRNLLLEIRGVTFASETARSLVTLRPDAIVSFTSRITRMVQEVAGPIPVVFTFVGDAVEYGLVKDYARPGTNSTGTSWRQIGMTEKRLQLVREMLPRAKRIVFAGWFNDVSFRTSESQIRAIATQLDLELIYVEFGVDIARAVGLAEPQGADAVFVYQPMAMLGLFDDATTIIRDATKRRMPVFFAESELVELGGVLSYGPSLVDEVRRAADLVARVLRGESPNRLPVELASHFKLAVNMKAAETLDLKIPQSILLRADRVIE